MTQWTVIVQQKKIALLVFVWYAWFAVLSETETMFWGMSVFRDLRMMGM